MAMAMARARARMAISHWCNGIRQISIRHFEAGAGQTNHNSNKGSCSYERPRGFGPSPLFHPHVLVAMFGLLCYRVSEIYKAEKREKEADERMRKTLEENGISREICEAKIAKLKEKIESGSASRSDRLDLKIEETWLKLLPKGIHLQIVDLLLLHSLNAAAPPSYDEASKKEGRVGQTTNVAIGGTVTDDSTDEWLSLDQKVKSYPTERGFTAIGTGDDDFVEAMVVAVESVLQQPIPELPTRNTVILNIVPNAARASAYKFGISVRLMRNICLWNNILAMPALEKIALDDLFREN